MSKFIGKAGGALKLNINSDVNIVVVEFLTILRALEKFIKLRESLIKNGQLIAQGPLGNNNDKVYETLDEAS